MLSVLVGACNPFTLKVVPEKHELPVVDLVPLLIIISVLPRVLLYVTHMSCRGLVLCVRHVSFWYFVLRCLQGSNYPFVCTEESLKYSLLHWPADTLGNVSGYRSFSSPLV